MPRWSKTSRSREPSAGVIAWATNSASGSAAWPGPPARPTTASRLGCGRQRGARSARSSADAPPRTSGTVSEPQEHRGVRAAAEAVPDAPAALGVPASASAARGCENGNRSRLRCSTTAGARGACGGCTALPAAPRGPRSPCRVRPAWAAIAKPSTPPAAPPAIGPYSHAVASGELLFCSGQIPLDPDSGEIVGETPGGAGPALPAEPERGLRRGRHLARACGALDGVHDRPVGVRRGQRGLRLVLRGESARACRVGVAALPRGAQVEIDAIVARGD